MVRVLCEELAAKLHEMWSDWARHLLSRGKSVVGGVLLLERDVENWRRWSGMPYADLHADEQSRYLHLADELTEVLDEWIS